ncbi:DUF4169 family protein [Sphingomonas sp. So64.6b]|uniref:DUF4169 family protein n=1 Tax=Sphingomonas sp. So64.6b TaxID=2997354 RepID=UPI0016003A11|nr:DUF4169 family protein [Sphingomonas sp. So64.6b]QNA85176.1 DUF4169 family protein [Sphingomonas sp. So64.6b]
MAEIINLRTARKAKARADAAAHADRNRAVFGRTKADKVAAAREQDVLARSLDGAKLSED